MTQSQMPEDPLVPDVVVLDLVARAKTEVLDRLSERIAGGLGCDAPDIAHALADRERLGSTGVGSGVAMPHADIPDLDRPVALFARLVRPVEWDAIDELPIDLVVVVLSPSSGVREGATRLSRFARVLRHPDARRGLLTCPTVEGVLEIFAEEG